MLCKEEMGVMKTINYKSKHDSGLSEPQGSKTGLGISHPPTSDARQQLMRLAKAQDVPVVRTVTDLAVDFWPEDESADDINSYIYGQRYDDRIRA